MELRWPVQTLARTKGARCLHYRNWRIWQGGCSTGGLGAMQEYRTAGTQPVNRSIRLPGMSRVSWKLSRVSRGEWIDLPLPVQKGFSEQTCKQILLLFYLVWLTCVLLVKCATGQLSRSWKVSKESHKWGCYCSEQPCWTFWLWLTAPPIPNAKLSNFSNATPRLVKLILA